MWTVPSKQCVFIFYAVVFIPYPVAATQLCFKQFIVASLYSNIVKNYFKPKLFVTEIGSYDSYGRVVLNNKEYEISENSDEQEGVMISDVTWNYIKNHKSYKDMNLYHMLTQK